jgi:hypothetical protein
VAIRSTRYSSRTPDNLLPPSIRWKLNTKFKWKTAQFKRMIDATSAVALEKAGADVREATRKQMSNRAPRNNAVQWKIADRHGYELIARIDKVPKSDRVTSWKTSRFPGGYLRSQIQSDFSTGKKSVVVGPEAGGRDPRVNQLQEIGGPASYYFVPGGKQRKSGRKVYGTLSHRAPRVYGTQIAQVGLYRFTRAIKGRHFMERGLKKAAPKIPECWRGQLRIG